MTVTFAQRLARMPGYQAGVPTGQAPEAIASGGIAQLASNESPFPPHPKVVEAIERAAGAMHRYPDPDATLLRRRLADVDVDRQVLGRRVEVQHHPDHPRHRAGDRNLAAAHQRHHCQPEVARCHGRELGVEVVRGREQAADHRLRLEPVALDQLPHQLLGRP